MNFGIIGFGRIARKFVQAIEATEEGKIYAISSRSVSMDDPYLKEHPEVKSVYRDINIDFLILQTTRKIMYEEENEIEQDRQISNDFIPAVGVPFL